MYLLKNFAEGILSLGITASSGNITVNARHTLPQQSGSFVVILWDPHTAISPASDPTMEICIAQWSSGNIYSLTRAQESTIAKSHLAGAKASMAFTAGVMQQIQDSVLTWPTLPLSRDNGGTGVTGAAGAANSVVNLDASAKLPAYDGSQLTGIVIPPNLSNLAFVFIPNLLTSTSVYYNNDYDIGVTQFKKIAGVNTLTLYARYYSDANGLTIKVTINGVVSSMTGAGSGYQTATNTISVSGCTTNTIYDVTATARSDGGSGISLISIIGIAS